ncbi:MAG: hypothetical protein ACM3VT_19640, partial [Solirubrobacterales bacterium]
YPTIEEIKSMQRILGVAKREGVRDSWVAALRVSVLLNRLRLQKSRLGRFLRRCKRAIAAKAGAGAASQPTVNAPEGVEARQT